MTAPLVSVIVPARDQADYIGDALTSLTRQFEESATMEVIVVDDGSTDGTGSLVAAFKGRLPNLQVLRNGAPAGVAAARNRGLDKSTGRYIAFLDADDWYSTGHLERMSQEIRRLGCDFIRVDHIRDLHGNRTVHRAPQARRGVVLDPRSSIMPHDEATMVDYCFPPFGIFDRRLLDSGLLHFPHGLHTAEDRPWIWRLHLRATSYAVSDVLGAFYRRGNTASLTQIYDRRQLDFLPCFEEIFRMLHEDQEAELFWPKAARQFYAITCHHLRRTNLMSRTLSHELHTRAGAVMELMPPAVRRRSFDNLDPIRRNLLASIVVRSAA